MSKSKNKINKVESKKTEKWPKIEKGSHLTVTRFEDGTVEMIWDDEMLLKDIETAILTHKSQNP